MFFPKLIYRRPKKGVIIELQDDTGDLLMPKVFRRQVTYRMQKQVGLISGSFAGYLADNPEECHTTKDFLKFGPHAAPTLKFHEFMKGKTFTVIAT